MNLDLINLTKGRKSEEGQVGTEMEWRMQQ
jgi:hypothetical protein